MKIEILDKTTHYTLIMKVGDLNIELGHGSYKHIRQLKIDIENEIRETYSSK